VYIKLFSSNNLAPIFEGNKHLFHELSILFKNLETFDI